MSTFAPLVAKQTTTVNKKAVSLAPGLPYVSKQSPVSLIRKDMLKTPKVPEGSFKPLRPIQQKLNVAAAPKQIPSSQIHTIAKTGVQGGGEKLPYFNRIQQAFGQHDLSHIKTYRGHTAAIANHSIGAKAYATGNKIAFAEANPNLHTVAHEAAHIVQQRAGVHLKSGVGEANDRYERQADQVAERVIRNQPVDSLLSAFSPLESNSLKPNTEKFSESSGSAVQRLPLDVENRLARQASSLGTIPFMTRAISDWLESKQIPHRIGGSLAARLQGGGRHPGDIDIEVDDKKTADNALTEMKNINGVTVTGTSWPVGINLSSSAVNPIGIGGGIATLDFIPHNPTQISIDIVNENHGLNNMLISPNARGIRAGYGNLVGSPELIVNYLNRIITKNNSAKNDPQQIIDLLLADGFDPSNSAHKTNLQETLRPLIDRGSFDAFLEILSKIIQGHWPRPRDEPTGGVVGGNTEQKT